MKLKKIAAYFLAIVMTGALCGGAHAQASDTQVPVLMYHHLTTDGQTNSMTITAERFREDMEYLSNYGYTPLLSADLMAIKAGSQPMPEKPVMITFDDGYESNYTLAYPILQETGMKATISLITSHIRGGESEGIPTSMTWTQAKEMYESGIVDIGTHTHRLHNEENGGFEIPGGPDGVQRLRGESWMEYQKRVGQDIRTSVRTIQAHLGATVRVWYFSYPFGATDPWFGQVLSDNGLSVSTTTKATMADIGGGLYGLSRYRVTMDEPVSKLLTGCLTARPAQASVEIDGARHTLPAYRVNDDSYVRLRDIALLLQDTGAQFAVGWADGAVTLQKGAPYEANGSELAALDKGIRLGLAMTNPVMIDGQPETLPAYNIEGSYYFELENLGQALGLQVELSDGIYHIITE